MLAALGVRGSTNATGIQWMQKKSKKHDNLGRSSWKSHVYIDIFRIYLSPPLPYLHTLGGQFFKKRIPAYIPKSECNISRAKECRTLWNVCPGRRELRLGASWMHFSLVGHQLEADACTAHWVVSCNSQTSHPTSHSSHASASALLSFLQFINHKLLLKMTRFCAFQWLEERYQYYWVLLS